MVLVNQNRINEMDTEEIKFYIARSCGIHRLVIKRWNSGKRKEKVKEQRKTKLRKNGTVERGKCARAATQR